MRKNGSYFCKDHSPTNIAYSNAPIKFGMVKEGTIQIGD